VSVESPYANLLAGTPVRQSSVRIMGGDTKYWVYGPDDAETTIVVVHGYRGEHHGLEPVIAQLRGLRVISPDLPGFGESSALVGVKHDIAGYSHWLGAFVDALGVRGTAVIVGHSFGSIVSAAAVAGGLDTPKLVLINPIAAPALSGPNAFMSRLTLLYYRAGRALPERLGAALLSSWLIVRFMSIFLAQTKDPALRSWIHDQHHTHFSRYATRDSVVEGFEASISSDVSMYAADITAPTLLIGADHDPITTVEDQRRLQTLFPDARLVMLDGVGHLVHYEKPREAAAAIIEFLEVGSLASMPVAPEPATDLKIIFDCRYTRIGRHDGISRYGARLVEELGKLHPVTMLVSDERQLDMLPDLPWVHGPDPTAATEPWVARTVNAFGPDVVFTPMQTMGPWGRNYALVTTVHDLIYYTHRTPPRDLGWALRLLWRGYHLSWAFQRALLNRADAHLVDSETTRDLMLEHRLTRNPMRVVLLGTDHPETVPVRSAPTSRELVYMGSFMPYKNVELLARALASLPGYRLRLMSRVTDHDRTRIEVMAAAGRIEFLDGASDEQYADALLSATALVSASRDEGFGLPVVEAQALGTPVLLNDIAIFREIGGPAAGYFDGSSIESFVHAVRELEDPAEWERRSAASTEWSMRYNWPDAAKQLLEVLTEAHERRTAATRKRARFRLRA
jgi:pimeloyl-ACP methyl ester carboxylesterase/glycosyltransferase involved in cell wall biosynthesis